MNGQTFPQQPEDLNKNVTLGVLLEYTDEFLLPRMEERVREVVKEEIGQSEHRVKDYIDRKLSDHTAEFFRRLEHKFQTEQQFRGKIIDLFKKHNIGTSEDLAFLEGLMKGAW